MPSIYAHVVLAVWSAAHNWRAARRSTIIYILHAQYILYIGGTYYILPAQRLCIARLLISSLRRVTTVIIYNIKPTTGITRLPMRQRVLLLYIIMVDIIYGPMQIGVVYCI